jgi:hypothetical protein
MDANAGNHGYVNGCSCRKYVQYKVAYVGNSGYVIGCLCRKLVYRMLM